jgi:hypothetical protein
VSLHLAAGVLAVSPVGLGSLRMASADKADALVLWMSSGKPCSSSTGGPPAGPAW